MIHWRNPTGGIRGLTYGRDGRSLFSIDSSGLLRRWDYETGSTRELLHSTRNRHGLHRVASGANDRLFALWDLDGSRIWDEQARDWVAIRRPVNYYFAALSPDGQWIAAPSGAHHLRLLPLGDPAGRRPEQAINVEPEVFETRSDCAIFQFSPDSQTLAGALWNGDLRVWSLGSTEEPLVLAGTGRLMRHLTFSSDGRLLAATDDRGLVVWDLDTAKILCRISSRNHGVTALALHPSGSSVIAALTPPRSIRSLLVQWTLPNGAETTRYDWDLSRILGLAIAPDGLTAAAGGSNRGIVTWDLDF